MSIARRPAKCRIACLRCAAQNRPPEQRWSLPPFSRTTALPHTGQRLGHAEVRHVALALAGHPAHHLGNHVAGAPHDHRVADAHALAAQLEQVVQRGVAHRRAADEHRLELGHRRQLAGAADLDLDAVQPRLLLLRRVLVRHRPARLARLEAELLLQRAFVDLVDHAVDVERQRVALGGDASVEQRQLLATVGHVVPLVDRKAELGQRIQQSRVARWDVPALHFAQAIREEAQRPLACDAGIELAHDARDENATILGFETGIIF